MLLDISPERLILRILNLKCEGYEIGALYKLLAPILSEADALYWLTDTGSGPVDSSWLFENLDVNEEILERYTISSEYFSNTSSCLHKPGMLRKYGHALISGEDPYYVAINANNDNDATTMALAVNVYPSMHISNVNFIHSFQEYGTIYATIQRDIAYDYKWIIIFNDKYGDIAPFIEYYSGKKWMLAEIDEEELYKNQKRK